MWIYFRITMKKNNRHIPEHIAKRGPCVALVADGETEQWYFKGMKQTENLTCTIKPEFPEPKTIEAEFEKVQELVHSEYDYIFWIVDVDVVNKEGKWHVLVDSINACEQRDDLKEKVCVILNNPCLEYWLLLHFKQTTKYFSNYSTQKKELLKTAKLQDYEKSEKYYLSKNSLYKRLRSELPQAVQHAKMIAPFNGEQPHQALCNMFKVMEYFNIS